LRAQKQSTFAGFIREAYRNSSAMRDPKSPDDTGLNVRTYINGKIFADDLGGEFVSIVLEREREMCEQLKEIIKPLDAEEAK